MVPYFLYLHRPQKFEYNAKQRKKLTTLKTSKIIHCNFLNAFNYLMKPVITFPQKFLYQAIKQSKQNDPTMIKKHF